MVKSSPRIPWRERLNLSRWAIARPRWTIACWLAVTVSGLLALGSLQYALFPAVNFPVVVVNVTAPIETALATESQLTQPIEQGIAAIEGVYDLRSTTLAGRTIISAAFLVGTRLEDSTESVKSILQRLPLPAEASYEVLPLNLNESTAISYAILSQDKPLTELTQIAKAQIIPEIEQLPGVLKVNLLGEGSSSDPALANLSSQTFVKDPPTLVRFNGENALAFQVVKRGDANTLEVVDRVEDAVETLQKKLPDVRLELAETQAKYIREATQSTLHELMIGIVLAILVIFPFLRNWRATLISAIAIPLSLLGTFIVMAVLGFNLETITLLALALVIGIVVDDAIVDVENISRHLQLGESSREAAIKATDEIGLTVTASTLSIVVVFLPVAFMGDALGQFFKPFALTISAAVLISLLVSRTLSPVLAMYWLRNTDFIPENSPRNLSQDLPENSPRFSAFSPSNITLLYQNILRWSLNHRGWVIGIAMGSFITGIALIPFVPQGFLPKLDRGEFNVIYTTKLPNLPSNVQVRPGANSASNPESEPDLKAPTSPEKLPEK
ncbi:MAG: efflux RND transporter permease subunit, partial [Microcoleaceae cyanobacterium]